MIGPKQDPYHLAAAACLDGDFRKAFEAIRDTWIERVLQDFEPDDDADEDGPHSNPRADMKRAVETETDGYIDSNVSDAVYEILATQQGVDEDTAIAKAKEIETPFRAELVQHIDEITDEAYDMWSDGAAYARDPNAYYGVSNKDFM